MTKESYQDLDQHFPPDVPHRHILFRRLPVPVVPGAVSYRGHYDITGDGDGDGATDRVWLTASARKEFEAELRAYCDDFRIWCDVIPDAELDVDEPEEPVDVSQLIIDGLLLGDDEDPLDDEQEELCLPEDIVVELSTKDDDERGLIVFEIDPWVKKGRQHHYHGADRAKMIVRCRRCELKGVLYSVAMTADPCVPWAEAKETRWKSAPRRACSVRGIRSNNHYRIRGGWDRGKS